MSVLKIKNPTTGQFEAVPTIDPSPAISQWIAENLSQETGYVIDTSLSVPGAAADAGAVGAEIGELKSQIDYGSVTVELKTALLRLAQKVAYIDADGQDYYDDLYDALYPLDSITAVYTQSGTVYTTDSLDSLKTDLVVTAVYDGGTTATVPGADYTLSGSLTEGTSTITASYGGETATFTVTVTAVPGTYTVTNMLTGCTNSNTAATVVENASYSGTIEASAGYTLTGATVSITMGNADITASAYSNGTISIASVTGNVVIAVTAVAVVLSSISAVYTQSGTVYDTDDLDDLRDDLVVTATYSDSSTATVPRADYTLSGTLTMGTSTITASYGGKTDTFNVTVTQDASNIETVTTLVNGTDWNYESGKILNLTTGATSDNGSWNTSDYIPVPDGSTSFSRVTSRTSDWYLSWYDENKEFVGNGLGGTYSGAGQYGGGYTDTNNVLWNVVPVTAKYCRVSWRTNATYTSLTFKHNIKLDASKNPVAGKVYYYTYNAESTGSYITNTDYLKCAGMAYAQIRPIIRRSITFYDAEFIKVSEVATANNIGNNVAIPAGAVYLKCTNTNEASTVASNPSLIGQRLIEFTDTSLSEW